MVWKSKWNGSRVFLMKNEVCPFCKGDRLKVDSKRSRNIKFEGTTRYDLHVVTVRFNKCHCKGPTASIWLKSGRYNAIEIMHEKAYELWNRRD